MTADEKNRPHEFCNIFQEHNNSKTIIMWQPLSTIRRL